MVTTEVVTETGDGITTEIERIDTNVGPDLAPKIDLSIYQIQDHLLAPKVKGSVALIWHLLLLHCCLVRLLLQARFLGPAQPFLECSLMCFPWHQDRLLFLLHVKLCADFLFHCFNFAFIGF
nr:splicing factor U2af large subunit A-like isoform X5 [Ipomoea batatas]